MSTRQKPLKGGGVHGHEGVRDYSTRQYGGMDPAVTSTPSPCDLMAVWPTKSNTSARSARQWALLGELRVVHVDAFPR
jgi:hypothetical protein